MATGETHPLERHHLENIRTICVFCGSSDRIGEIYLLAGASMGHALAKHHLTLVYGGGRTGLMGALADKALEEGAKVIGVIPEAFDTPALAHTRLTEMHVVKTMHERKAKMVALSDAFLALPGGFGTFEELFEILTWAQIGLHSKPIGVLNVHGYFTPLLHLIGHAHQEGFIYGEHRQLIIEETDPERLLNQMIAYRPPQGLQRWVKREMVNETESL
jgi:uncharacterized protein (TIGR00730 family)